jgi:hypothetical protein
MRKHKKERKREEKEREREKKVSKKESKKERYDKDMCKHNGFPTVTKNRFYAFYAEGKVKIHMP